IVVGVNEYRVEERPDFAIFRPDPAHARKQISDLQRLRKTRDQDRVKSALDLVREAAREHKNLMPLFIEAVKAYATLGEICGVLRDVFGEYQQADTLRKR
ncbi:MAG: methylmalonyl-CoA mutase, partial [Desulfobacteraceae bacterium]|nr:methylmalonyl-CoA mutase [Desulfobacteraceae bacterium]